MGSNNMLKHIMASPAAEDDPFTETTWMTVGRDGFPQEIPGDVTTEKASSMKD